MKKHYLESLINPVNPTTTVVVFDLHNVVFKKQTRKIVLSALKLLPKGTWRYTFNPALWWRVYRFKTTSCVAEDIFQKVSAIYPGISDFRSDFIRMTNAQKPIKPVVELIKQLRQRGFKLYILSNIGDETFIQLSEQYPDVRGHFHGAFTATAANNYKHKPQPDFYVAFKEYLIQQGESGKQILFVDDLKKNLVSAARYEIAGLHYSSPRKLARAFKFLEML